MTPRASASTVHGPTLEVAVGQPAQQEQPAAAGQVVDQALLHLG